MSFQLVKKNNKKLVVCLCLLIIAVIIGISLMKYKMNENIKLVEGKINYDTSNLNKFAVYLESENGYVSSDSIPTHGYALNQSESYCRVGNVKTETTVTYNRRLQSLSIAPIANDRKKCYLYFDIIEEAGTVIVDSYLTNQQTITVYVSAGDEKADISKILIAGWYGGWWVQHNVLLEGTYDAATNRYYATFTFSELPDTTSGATNQGDGQYYFQPQIYYNDGIVVVPDASIVPNSYAIVTLDTTTPTVSYSVEPGTYNTTKSVTITGSDTNFGYMHINVYKDNTIVNEKSVVQYTGTSYTVDLDSDGTWTIYTQVYDSAGNKQNQSPDNGGGWYYQNYTINTAPLARDTILANKTISNRTDFSTELTTDTTGTVFSAEDDDGTTYYYAGAPTDNWVKFAGYYWRIIRINGDGTIRLIYNGGNTTQKSASTHIEASAFNTESGNAEYVGYMYTLGTLRGLGTSSNVKDTLESWYSYTGIAYNYASYIDTNAGFCGDRTPYADTAGTSAGYGTGNNMTYFGAYIRLITNKAPSFKCSNSTDLYTVASSSKGNQALTYPIGLITADEVVYAGYVYNVADINDEFYLYTGQYYWTMTPVRYYRTYYTAEMFAVDNNANPNTAWTVTYEWGVRPVINLRADVTLSGTGTAGNPYTVS